MFRLVALVQPEVDRPELLFRLFINSQTRSTSELSSWEDCGFGKEPAVGLPLPDSCSCDDYYRLVSPGWEECSPGMESVLGLPLQSYNDANDYYPHFGLDCEKEWWDYEIDALGLIQATVKLINTFAAKHLKKSIPQCQACFKGS